MRPLRDLHPYRRSIALLVLCLATLGAIGIQTAPFVSAKSRPGRRLCMRYSCRTLAADPQVRIFQAISRHPGLYAYQSTFARWLPSGHLTALGDSLAEFEGPSLRGLALSGRFAAYGLQLNAERYPGEGVSYAIIRLNIQRGHRERVPANGPTGGRLGEDSLGLTDIVATPAGTVAWIIDGSFLSDGKTPPPGSMPVPLGSKALWELPARSKTPTLLAFNPTIGSKSLAAVPGRLYWTEAGQPRTATIE